MGGEEGAGVLYALTGCDDLGGEVGRFEVVAERVDVVAAVRALVPDADVVDVQPVHIARTGQPLGGVHRSGVGQRTGPALCHPRGEAPAQPVQLDVGVAALGLLHQPPLVAALVVLLLPDVHVRRLGTLGGLGVTADLDLEDVEGGAEVRDEEVVEDLLQVGAAVGGEKLRRGAAPGEAADAVERAAEGGGRHRVRPGHDRMGRGGSEGAQGSGEEGEETEDDNDRGRHHRGKRRERGENGVEWRRR